MKVTKMFMKKKMLMKSYLWQKAITIARNPFTLVQDAWSWAICLYREYDTDQIASTAYMFRHCIKHNWVPTWANRADPDQTPHNAGS